MGAAENGYDIVGDVHGHSMPLEALLLKMGYLPEGRSYRPPQGRQLVFLGDLIDRGPGQLRVLEISRSMVENGAARCLMGNHEFNAIGYVTPSSKWPGEYLRPNRQDSEISRKNREQHESFLQQVGQDSAQHLGWVDWFRTLPPFLDLGGIRVAHACWDQEAVNVLSERGWCNGVTLEGDLLLEAYDPESRIKWARELLTCGLEIALPSGRHVIDKAGHRHPEVRVASWRHWATEFHEIALIPKGQEELLKGMEWPAELVISEIEGPPIFVGHHWFSGHPVIESPKLACLDWSVAKGGKLVAYRWSGEADLSNGHLTWV
jgi:Calcineurin-like phosphoesterase